MAQSSACCNPCQNPHDSKDELASKTPIERCDRRTPAFTASHASTSAIAPVVALLAASGSANSSVVKYSEDDLQRILRIVFNSRPPAPVLAPAAAPHYEALCEKSLKAWFLDIYEGKTHLECYNFFQQCKDHFASAGATGPN